MIPNFDDFINEDFTYDVGVISDFTFDEGWYYYEQEDEIIFGCDEEPVNIKCLFYFNPKTCSVYIGGKKIEYDINNPICLIRYLFKDDEVQIYKGDEVFKYFDTTGYKISGDISSETNRSKIQDMFMGEDDQGRQMVIYGNDLIASTFDIIEEKEGGC